ncbi:MAG: zf-HC2 domain-containing protein [Bryobacteraceae bacterium]|nr:zf-HC2 domain-containing protein [Bryobacteraceae bacterium]
MKRSGAHPDAAQLALEARGDLGFWESWKLRRHLAECPSCDRELKLYAAAAEGLARRAAELPADLNWNRLAAEMKANIRLGLYAGEIVGGRESAPVRLTWRAALAIAAVTVLVISGWWLHVPKPDGALDAEPGIVLAAGEDGLELKEGGSALTLRHPDPEHVTWTVTAGGADARYVDAQSGQVTINKVYAE